MVFVFLDTTRFIATAMAMAEQEVFSVYLNEAENLLHWDVSESRWLVVRWINENRQKWCLV